MEVGGREQYGGRLHPGLPLSVSSAARSQGQSQGQSQLSLICSKLLLLTMQLDQHFLGPG